MLRIVDSIAATLLLQQRNSIERHRDATFGAPRRRMRRPMQCHAHPPPPQATLRWRHGTHGRRSAWPSAPSATSFLRT